MGRFFSGVPLRGTDGSAGVSAERNGAVSHVRGRAGEKAHEVRIRYAGRVTEENNGLGVVVQRRREAPPCILISMVHKGTRL
ncbi:MAG TPA: hypothetical protein VLX29_08835 [Nitrospirota bacterium]|nr:hypothetical protein [Nitrospirota bacterium]